MSGCLDDRALWLLREGEGDAQAREHVRGCLQCAARVQRLEQELLAIGAILRADPPAGLSRRRSFVTARRLVTAAVLAGLVLLAGLEMLIWRASHSLGSVDEASTDAFLEQVSDVLSSFEDATATPAARLPE